MDVNPSLTNPEQPDGPQLASVPAAPASPAPHATVVRSDLGGLDSFINDARTKGWGDDQIKQTLSASGWSDMQIQVGLSGLTVPVPPSASPNIDSEAPAQMRQDHLSGRPSISALQAALQHVLLWVFTGTTSIMMSIVAFALFAAGDSSSEALLTYVVLELVTFTPFAFFYWRYLQQMRRQNDIMTGKVWSIITIVLHSVGLVGSVIALILVIVLVHDTYTTAGVVSSILVGTMDALVVAAYVLANFAKNTSSTLRRRYLFLFPTGLFILISTLGIAALIKVGPLRSDDQTMQNLTTTVNRVHDYAQGHRSLPHSLSDVGSTPSGVTYQRVTPDEFKVCATFKASHGQDYSSTSQDDSYVASSIFDGGSSGPHCWDFTDSAVQPQDTNIYNQYTSPDLQNGMNSSNSSAV